MRRGTDWDTFYFEYWVDHHEPGDEPTNDDYLDWLYDQADIALGGYDDNL